MEKSYLAFDLGASSGRGIIGKIKDGKLHLTEIHRFGNGPVEKDGALYWEFDKLCKEIKTGIKKAGFLTRDSRMRERKKYGRKRARRRFQFTKR